MQVYKGRREILGEEDPDTVKNLYRAAVCLEELGKYKQALELLEKAYKVQQQGLDEDDPQLADTAEHIEACRRRVV